MSEFKVNAEEMIKMADRFCVNGELTVPSPLLPPVTDAVSQVTEMQTFLKGTKWEHATHDLCCLAHLGSGLQV